MSDEQIRDTAKSLVQKFLDSAVAGDLVVGAVRFDEATPVLSSDDLDKLRVAVVRVLNELKHHLVSWI